MFTRTTYDFVVFQTWTELHHQLQLAVGCIADSLMTELSTFLRERGGHNRINMVVHDCLTKGA